MRNAAERNGVYCAELERAYRESFARWAREVAQVQAGVADSQSDNRSIAAQAAYRDSRDNLWRCLAADPVNAARSLCASAVC